MVHRFTKGDQMDIDQAKLTVQATQEYLFFYKILPSASLSSENTPTSTPTKILSFNMWQAIPIV